MITLKAKDYSTRSKLENKVKNLFGLTPELKVGYQVKGKRAELAKLHLSDKTTFWGIKCVITDSPSVVKPQTKKPQRGIIHNFGLNNKLKKPQ